MANEKQLLKPDFFASLEERFSAVGISKEKFLKEASFAVQAFNKNSYLNSATSESKLRAVYNLALTGLTLNPVEKLAYLVPRYNRDIGSVEACLEPSYMGLCKLATDTGSVTSITCNLVYMGDLFEPDLGSNVVKHLPYYTQGNDKGEIFGCYTISKLADGTQMFEFMSRDEVYDIRQRSESYKSYLEGKTKQCIWITDEGEMFRKTVIRRAVKYLPKTDRWEQLANAVDLDEADYKISDGQIVLIEGLIRNSTLDEEQRMSIEKDLNTMSKIEAGKTIDYLKQNQLDTIHTARGSETEYAKAIQKRIDREK